MIPAKPDAAEVRHWPPCKECGGLAEHPHVKEINGELVPSRRACYLAPEGCRGNYFGRMHPEQAAAAAPRAADAAGPPIPRVVYRFLPDDTVLTEENRGSQPWAEGATLVP